MDVKQYAKLLNSVAQQGTGSKLKRPLSPVECALAIRRLIDEEQESLDKIAERLNLGKSDDLSNMYKKRDTSQITMFLNLLKVSENSRDLAGWSTDDWPLKPFSTIAQLAPLTEEEQDIIIQSILQSKDKRRALGKEDVKKIKKWRKENPDLSIKECIEKVLKLKPVTVITHLVVMEIHDLLRRFIDSNVDCEKKLLGILNSNLSGKFHDINIGKSVITVAMDEEAYKPFHSYQHDKGLSYTTFLNMFLESHVG